jgi:predicted alpha/beta hydrolase
MFYSWDVTISVPIELTARDGYRLAAALFEPSSPRAALLINSATGVPKELYTKFARYLAGHGYAVLIHDYRGIGGSRRGSLRALADVRMVDWVQLDIAAALAELTRRWPSLPVGVIGHSIGGQLLPLVDGIDRVTSVLTVATSTGSWRKMSGRFRWFCAGVWYAYMPLTTRVVGYAPSSWIGQGEDLPAGVARQWGAWCKSDDYFREHLAPEQLERLATFERPWLSLSFTDDPISNRQTVPALHGFYPRATIESRFYTPAELGLPAVGHFGFFSSKCAPALWPQAAEFLTRTLDPTGARAGDPAPPPRDPPPVVGWGQGTRLA